MIRRYVMAGNWKMYLTAAQGAALARAVAEGSRDVDLDVVVIPPFTSIPAVVEAVKGTHVKVGAQHMYFEKEGAFTGEVSPVMLVDAGCTFVVLGHSERRHVFGEEDDVVGRKARAAVDHGLVPLICVGETLAERESRRTLEVIERQTERALRHLTPDEVGRIVISYEPVWAIGTGHVATPEQAQEVQAFIRKLVALSHGDPVSAVVRILYGGSVKPDNIRGLMAQGDIDGVLVGGASLKPESFLKIIHYK